MFKLSVCWDEWNKAQQTLQVRTQVNRIYSNYKKYYVGTNNECPLFKTRYEYIPVLDKPQDKYLHEIIFCKMHRKSFPKVLNARRQLPCCRRSWKAGIHYLCLVSSFLRLSSGRTVIPGCRGQALLFCNYSPLTAGMCYFYSRKDAKRAKKAPIFTWRTLHHENLALRASHRIPSGFITDFLILLRKILVTFGISCASLRSRLCES